MSESQRIRRYLGRGFAALRGYLTPVIDPLAAHPFAALGRAIRLEPGLRIEGAEGIALGDRVTVDRDAWLHVQHGFAEGVRLRVGDDSYVGMRACITAARRVELGAWSYVAHHTYITDHNHAYADPTRPIAHQGLATPGFVVIGRSVWVGVGAALIGAHGLTIGDNAVIGANAVVIEDVPPATVVAGNPARPVRRFDFERGEWVRVTDGRAP
jgi:acetyltransferase-like isoleucine patch superfamily enzyme